MRKKNIRNQQGITLIALVITIIIMLILVLVSINVAINGRLFDYAKTSTTDWKMEQLKEEVGTVLAKRKMMTYTNRNESLQTSLENGISGEKTITVLKPDTCTVTKNGITLTVYDDGDIGEGATSVWEGTTSSPECPKFKEENGVWNWYIYNADQLRFLQEYVNNGNSLTGDVRNLTQIVTDAGYEAEDVTIVDDTTKVYLMNNIDLGAREGTNGTTEEERWANEENGNAEYKWTPIGVGGTEENPDETKYFKGIFEGQGHTIRGVFVYEPTNPKEGYGIFGNAHTINELTIKNSYVKGNTYVGGIVGILWTGEMNNCNNIDVTVTGASYAVGGIAGYVEGTMAYCNNSGTVGAASHYVGGVAGYVTGAVTNCSNIGTVSGAAGSVGGVFGHARSAVSICKNSGAVNAASNSVGGIIGWIPENVEVTSCNNNGTVIGAKSYVGGIVGNTGTHCTITNCNNTAAVSSNVSLVGGIVGNASMYTTIDSCSNSATITGKQYRTGGLVGGADSYCIIKDSSNTGSVFGMQYVGGVVGILAHADDMTTNATVERCYNSGEVNGTDRVGGILGLAGGPSGKGTVKECYNKGIVNGATKVGEVMGYESNRTGLNTINKLFYLSNSRGLTAIGTEADDETNQIIGVEDDLTYEQFKTWILEQ